MCKYLYEQVTDNIVIYFDVSVMGKIVYSVDIYLGVRHVEDIKIFLTDP